MAATAATLAAIPDLQQDGNNANDSGNAGEDEAGAAAVEEVAAEEPFDPLAAHFTKASSRPTSPGEQIKWMANIDADEGGAAVPTEKDRESFDYYMNNAIPESQLADLEGAMIRFNPETKAYYAVPLLKEIESKTAVPKEVIDKAKLHYLVAELTDEAKADYRESQKRAIVEYLLQDPSERARLKIATISQPFTRRLRTVRAPVPWSAMVEYASSFLEQHLHLTNPVSRALLDTWASTYSDLRFINPVELRGQGPLHVREFVHMVLVQRDHAQRILQNEWIPSSVSATMEHRHHYMHMLHDARNPARAAQQFERFFGTIAALMSLQLRSMVENTLLDLCTFFERYRDGNNYSNVSEGHTWDAPAPAVHTTVASAKAAAEAVLKRTSLFCRSQQGPRVRRQGPAATRRSTFGSTGLSAG